MGKKHLNPQFQMEFRNSTILSNAIEQTHQFYAKEKKRKEKFHAAAIAETTKLKRDKMLNNNHFNRDMKRACIDSFNANNQID